MEVNNREWAILIWLAAITVMMVVVPTVRRSLGDVLRLLVSRPILAPLVLLVVYTGAAILVLVTLGVWDAKLITPTIVWFLTVALVSFFRLNRALTERHYFRNLALGAVAAPVAVQFVLDMYPFSLLTEILLQGAFLLLGALSAFSAGKPEHHHAHQVFNVIITGLVLVVVLRSVMEIVTHWSTIDFLSEVKKFVLPIGMTVAFLPFMYGFTLFAAYELAITRMRSTVPDGTPLVKPAAALMLRTGLSIRKLQDVTHSTRRAMARATTLRAAKVQFDQGQAAEAARLQAAADKQQQLLDNAGVEGIDENGQRLDRREFEETKAALDYLYLRHAGHYPQLGRYRDDMLEYLGAETFAKKGLPPEAGITMHVSPDGQRWWAWRRTVSGWVFAIGASEAPHDRWEYDGPDAPPGGPGSDPRWRHFMVPSEPHHHW